jgi:hypothetical protein
MDDRLDLEAGAQALVARYDLACRLLTTLIDWHTGPDHREYHERDSLTSDAYAISAVLLARSLAEFLSSTGRFDDDWRAADFVDSPPPFDIRPFNDWVNKAIAHATGTDTGFLISYVGLAHSLVSGMSRFVGAVEESNAKLASMFYDVQARWQEHPVMGRPPLRSRSGTVRGAPNRPPDFAWKPR